MSAAHDKPGFLRPPARPGRGALFLLPLLLLVLAGHLAGGFILDDYFHLERAGRPFSAEALRFAIHTDDYGIVLWPLSAPVRLDFLRPATMLSFWIEARIWRDAAWGYHLDNILLHLLNCAWLALLARRLGLSASTIAWITVAWGVSLQVVPAVGWISGRTELLCAAFTLSAVLAVDSWARGGRPSTFAAAVLCAALAPLAKETGVIAPALIFVMERLRRLRSPAAPARSVGPGRWTLLLLPAVAYVIVRFGVLHVPPPQRPYLEPLNTGADVLWLLGKPVLYGFVALFSLPLSHVSPLSYLHDHPVWLLVPAIAVALSLVYLGRRTGFGPLLLLSAWFVFALLPALPVLPTTLYLYLPLAGLALFFGFARDGKPERRPVTYWLVAWIVVGTAFHTVTAGFTHSAAVTLSRSAETAEREIRERRASILLLVDVPVWAYGLPAAVQLRDSTLTFETWILNFSPAIKPGSPSTLAWPDGTSLIARSPGGGYFDSPVERFLLFDASPAAVGRDLKNGLLEVHPEPVIPNPPTLRVQFRDRDALDRCAIVQFRGWDAVAVPTPVPSRR